jgi:hypothetical protein
MRGARRPAAHLLSASADLLILIDSRARIRAALAERLAC